MVFPLRTTVPGESATLVSGICDALYCPWSHIHNICTHLFAHKLACDFNDYFFRGSSVTKCKEPLRYINIFVGNIQLMNHTSKYIQKLQNQLYINRVIIAANQTQKNGLVYGLLVKLADKYYVKKESTYIKYLSVSLVRFRLMIIIKNFFLILICTARFVNYCLRYNKFEK